ncbi:DNA ligase [Paenibacillus sp. S-38]|uniref:ATP-dependent DNA ligase n=1 Tax=Paenibacillus sp. S-38 TaxID=3416710 RepID=UPI003CE7146C
MPVFKPMSPILTDRLPQGEGWGYQLKWDGFRTLALVNDGRVELFSKYGLPKSKVYPDLAEALSLLPGRFLLDGEAVLLDPKTGRPSFQRMQQRDKLTDPALIRRAARRSPVQYIAFDLLQLGGEDLRGRPFRHRHEALQELAAGWTAPLYTAQLFPDGDALWDWVCQRAWEGVIAKRLDSPYAEGKDHRDWYKRKTALRLEAEAVGVIYREGRVASLVLQQAGRYLGRASSGLDADAKRVLGGLPAVPMPLAPPGPLPEGLRGADIRWLAEPLPVTVSGRELTEAGLLRHPKLLAIGGRAL